MSTLPKIPLDSASDLAFLRLQLQQALSSRLQEHLPNALPEDAFRTQIEAHIATFLSTTMQEASGNVLLNGLPPRPSEVAKGVQVEAERYEALDTGLQQAVSRKHAELEALVTDVARLRRDVPDRVKQLATAAAAASSSTAGTTTERTSEGDAHDAKRVKIDKQGQEGGGDDDDDDGPPPTVSLARLDEVVRTYERAVETMKAIKAGVGSVSAKVARAREVLTHLQQEQASAGPRPDAVAIAAAETTTTTTGSA